MSEETLDRDLFGDPVLPRRGGPGRPEVVWSRSTSDRVLLCFARGLSVKETAEVIGLSQPTLRKVFFSECRKRKQARVKLEMLQLARLNDAAAAGNVSAERELALRLDKLRLRDAAEAQTSPAPTKERPLGKKEAAQMAAMEQRGLYEPPPPPPTTH